MEARPPGKRERSNPLRTLTIPLQRQSPPLTHIILRVIRFADRFVLEREIGSGACLSCSWAATRSSTGPSRSSFSGRATQGPTSGPASSARGAPAASLSHPNIVQVYDAGRGEVRGREASYIVMEYVPGGDLKALIDRRGSLSGGELLRLSEAAAGLTHAHERGVIHRDVKPHNILLDENGRPKISDFGIARALDATYATRTGSYLGTALYSPRAAEGREGNAQERRLLVRRYPLPRCDGPAALRRSPDRDRQPARLQGADSAPRAQRRGEPGAGGPDPRLHEEGPRRPPERRRGAAGSAGGRTRRPRHRNLSRDPGDGTHQDRVRRSHRGTATGHRAKSARWRKGGTSGRRGGILVALAVVAVLAVIGALAVPRLIGGGNDQAGGEPPQNNAGQNPSGGGQNAQAGGGGQQAASQPASAPAGQAGGDQAQASGGSSEAQAAERTVQEFYTSSSAGNYDRSAQLSARVGGRARSRTGPPSKARSTRWRA